MKKLFVQKIAELVTIINDVDYDNIQFEQFDEETGDSWTYTSWMPAIVNGVYNPDLADRLLRRAQGELFHIMERAGLPLYGWRQFDAFWIAFLSNHNLNGAYRAALAETPEYRKESR